MQAAAQSSSFSEDKESAHQDAATKLVSQQQATISEGSHTNDVASEIARFGAIKEKKHSLESGIEIFNRSALPSIDTDFLYLPQCILKIGFGCLRYLCL